MVAWPYLFAPLESDLTFDGDFPDLSLTVDNGADFASNPGWLTLNGSDQCLRVSAGSESQNTFSSFFQPGAGGILIGMKFNAPTPISSAELLSAPGSINSDVRGLGVRIQTDGDASFLVDGNTDSELQRSTLAAADGGPHTVMFYLNAGKKDSILFFDGQGIALNRYSPLQFLHSGRIDFSLPSSGNDFDILIGARQGESKEDSPDNYLACQVRSFLWMNFGTAPPRHSRLIRMADQFHDDGEPGSEFE